MVKPSTWFLATAQDKHWVAMHTLTKLPLDLYHCVAACPFQPQQATETNRRFATLYQSLSTEAAQKGVLAWVQKPKLHLMQELLEYAALGLGNPQNCWTYRDESWVGWLGEATHRRGGQDTPVCATQRALQRYKALAAEADDFKAS